MINFSQELNSEQLNVVQNGDGPCLVLAGAGSGKTRVITYRVAYLLEQGINPENILLVTFTNKAASEMVERIKSLTGQEEKMPWAGTFHSIGHKILRQHASELGYEKNFSILDSDDSESLIKLAAKDFSISSKGKKFPTAGVLQGIISFVRNTEKTVNQVVEERYPQFLVFADAIVSIMDAYEERKKEANAMDFDDLLLNTLRLLNIPKISEKYSEQFQYILVDEYQDTNQIQAAIVKKMAAMHKNILVVGDDAQSIYSFRGANIENILQFEKDFPEAKIFRLETNYRSSQEILSLANAVIANNPKQYKKNLKTILKTGARPEFLPHGDQSEEAIFIANKVASLIRGGVEEKEIAVLFRAAHHSQALELELMRLGIDYDYRGGLRFFERSHVKDVLAYLRILNNLADTTAWLRVLMFEEGIGPSSAGKIIDAVKRLENMTELEKLGWLLPEKGRIGWSNFLRIWNKMLEAGPTNPAELVNKVISSPYKQHLEAEKLDSSERLEDLKQLAVFAGRYENLEKFLADAALQEAFNLQRQKEKKEKIKDGKIVLSTIHQSKGLEWSAVFVINLSQGAFPNERALREDGGLEEERRLFYVAVTRAKKYLYLTFPMSNTRNSNSYAGAWGENFVNEPSMFMSEVDSELLEDRSFLKNIAVLNDPSEGVVYEREDQPSKNIRPGSFLVDVDEL